MYTEPAETVYRRWGKQTYLEKKGKIQEMGKMTFHAFYPFSKQNENEIHTLHDVRQLDLDRYLFSKEWIKNKKSKKIGKMKKQESTEV